MFKPTYLYIKTHNITGLKYFGKTINDPFKYKGSGSRWLNHINYHGNDVSTEILGYYLDESECKDAALSFSETHKIVESTNWANLEPEDGLNGGFGSTGIKNSQAGSFWITNGVDNKKLPAGATTPEGWSKGRKVPDDWGSNVRQKLKGRTHNEMLGEDKAKILAEQKRQRMIGNKFAKS